jgi:hypothetical protein
VLFIVFGPEWRSVLLAMDRERETIPMKLKSALVEETPETVSEAKKAALRLPAKGRKHTGLRGRIAAGVGARPTPGGIRITTSMPSHDEAIIPRGMDRTMGWRHPVYGNQNVWVRQRGYSWFRETVADNRRDYEDALTDVLESSAHNIADAGGIARPGF